MGLPKLSPSALSLFKDCPRCFWLSKNKVAKPRGIFPSLPGGMDEIIKDWHDKYRIDGEKLPPVVAAQLPEGARAFKDLVLLNKWRQLGRGMSTTVKWATHEVGIGGLLDDLLTFPAAEGQSNKDGLVFSPYDYKTKKGPPPAPDYPSKYYGHQVDIYDLLLGDTGYPTNGDGYFAFYTPESVKDPSDENIAAKIEPINFEVTVIPIDTSAERAKEFIIRACECLMGDLPDIGDGCEYCTYTKKRALKIQEIVEARKRAKEAAAA